jgi:hypothetical protein
MHKIVSSYILVRSSPVVILSLVTIAVYLFKNFALSFLILIRMVKCFLFQVLMMITFRVHGFLSE